MQLVVSHWEIKENRRICTCNLFVETPLLELGHFPFLALEGHVLLARQWAIVGCLSYGCWQRMVQQSPSAKLGGQFFFLRGSRTSFKHGRSAIFLYCDRKRINCKKTWIQNGQQQNKPSSPKTKQPSKRLVSRQLGFFLSSYRARSRLWQSSNRMW